MIMAMLVFGSLPVCTNCMITHRDLIDFIANQCKQMNMTTRCVKMSISSVILSLRAVGDKDRRHPETYWQRRVSLPKDRVGLQ